VCVENMTDLTDLMADAGRIDSPPLPEYPEWASRNQSDSEERFRLAYEEAAVGMVMLDLTGHVIAINKSITEITGYTSSDLLGRCATEILAPEHHEDYSAAVAQIIASGRGGYRRERRLVRRDKRSIWVRNSAAVLHRDGKPAEIFVICEDITERRKATERLEHQATHDELTGLKNRRQLERLLTETAFRCMQTGRQAGLLYLDLDGFKLINDTLGHWAGDIVLQQVARELSRAVEEGDILARFGGDEFAIIAPQASDHTALERKAARLLRALKTPFHVGDRELHISASVGIAVCPTDGEDAGALLQNADAAMYASKRQGRNRFTCFTSVLREDAGDRLRIESNLRTALESREICAAFQPEYNLHTGSLVRFEALCRWRSRELGEVDPSRFVPVAEEIGVIGAIGRFMLHAACREAVRWQHAGSTISVAVNVSPVQFARQDFIDTVIAALRETGLKPARLELELTEGVLIRDIEQSLSRIDRLRELGVRIAIDDFGTGYSSLGYLQRMPVDALKIDRSFVRDLDQNPQSVSMVRAIIAMARALGLRVVTEGVETEAQSEILRRLGCDEVQGYLFGRAEMPEAAFARVEKELAHRVQRPGRRPRPARSRATANVPLQSATPITAGNSRR
jgi:diguanylate cyclase (GGDEF)-like protein/PAS domain S-box-containing protein